MYPEYDTRTDTTQREQGSRKNPLAYSESESSSRPEEPETDAPSPAYKIIHRRGYLVGD